MNRIEVCFSPILFDTLQTKGECVIVVNDILRATTSMCTAFDTGVESIIPVWGEDIARQYKEKGFVVASEKDCLKSDFADFGNSAFYFMNSELKGKTLVYNTTNGTKAIEVAAKRSNYVVLGAFINLAATVEWVLLQQKDVIIFCSGWKNSFCLEDTLYAGALIERLVDSFEPFGDAAIASIDLWNIAKVDLNKYIEKLAHVHRLESFGLADVVPYTFKMDISNVLPILVNNPQLATDDEEQVNEEQVNEERRTMLYTDGSSSFLVPRSQRFPIPRAQNVLVTNMPYLIDNNKYK